VPEDIQKQVEDYIQQVADGEIEVPTVF